MAKNFPYQRSTIIFLVLAMLISGYYRGIFKGKSHLIEWDVYGYYMYLPQIFIAGSVHDFTITESHFTTYKPSTWNYQVLKLPDGKKSYNYTGGLCYLWLPFFLIAHWIALLLPGVPADGVSFPYQCLIWFATFIYCYIGIRFLYLVLIRIVTPSIAMLTIGLVLLATNALYYLIGESAMPHILLWAVYSGLLYALIRYHEQPGVTFACAIGALTAILMLSRPSEVLALVLVVGYKPVSGPSLFKLFRRYPAHLIIMGGVMFLLALPQIFIWWKTSGQLLLNPYASNGLGFQFLRPFFYECLIGFRKGWWLYTPFMLLVIPGIYIGIQKLQEWRVALTVFILLQIWVICSWDIWWYGSCFGQRAMIQMYAPVSLLIALIIQYCYTNKIKKIFFWLFTGACLMLNLFQTWQVMHKILPLDGVTKTLYWKLFGKTYFKKEWWVYGEIDEELPYDKYKQVTWLNTADTLHWSQGKGKEYGQSLEFILDTSDTKVLSKAWLRLGTHAYMHTDEDPNCNAKLVFTLERKGQNLMWKGASLQRVIPVGKWTTMQYDLQLPAELHQGDKIAAYIWTPDNPDSIAINNISISRINPL